jgi:hypothetical protein
MTTMMDLGKLFTHDLDLDPDFWFISCHARWEQVKRVAA